jgi:hypothetical protein
MGLESKAMGDTKMSITRGQLGDILSGQMPTRTRNFTPLHTELEIDDDWIVRLIAIDSNGILDIYCAPPESELIREM